MTLHDYNIAAKTGVEDEATYILAGNFNGYNEDLCGLRTDLGSGL